MIEIIDKHNPDVVVLAGFMRVLTPVFVDHYEGKILNIHPALLPLFKGLDTHNRALQAGVRVHGCTVHFVSSELDGGAIIGRPSCRYSPVTMPIRLPTEGFVSNTFFIRVPSRPWLPARSSLSTAAP